MKLFKNVHFLPFLLGVLTIFLNFEKSHGANILFYFSVATYSHRIAVWPLVQELAANPAHRVSFLSAFPAKEEQKNVNVTEVASQRLQQILGEHRQLNFIQRRLDGTLLSLWAEFQEFGTVICESLMQDPDYVSWVKSGTKFDLIFLDTLYNDCGYAIIHYHKAPFILIDTSHPRPWLYDTFGVPVETSWISDLVRAFPGDKDMNFLDRVANTLYPLWRCYSKVFWMYPRLEKAVNAGLDLHGEDRLDIRRLEMNASLVMTNTHFSLEYARSLPPLFVPVGGMHVDVKKIKNGGNLENGQNFPLAMQTFLDESGDAGFIYISFGTGAQIADAGPEIQQAFLHALGNSSGVRFLWKWEGVEGPQVPKNVFTAKWMNQAKILAHPHIKAFVSHGGLLSIEEAVMNVVPLIIFPIFAEQEYNAKRLERLGCGIRLEIAGMRQSDLQNAIEKILTDSSYKTKMGQISSIFKDRQNSPLETAIWWTEYVLRHAASGGAGLEHLRPLGIHQTWYQRRLLDVWAFLIGVTLFSFCLSLFFTYKIIRCLFSSVAAAPVVPAGKDGGRNGKLKKN